MQLAEIKQKINEILIEEFEIEQEQITPTARFKEDFDIDSLDLVDLVVVIERKFGFKVKGEELVKIKMLQEFYDYISHRVNPN
jgi:acyl carrier protein